MKTTRPDFRFLFLYGAATLLFGFRTPAAQRVSSSGGDAAAGTGLLPKTLPMGEGVFGRTYPSDRFASWILPESVSTGDLNGDGDMDDSIVQIFDIETSTLLALNQAGAALNLAGIPNGRPLPFLVDESEQGEIDLNKDGDTSDLVLALFDPSTGETIQTDLVADLAQYYGSTLLVRVSELNDGRDWDADGDLAEGAVLIVDTVDGSVKGFIPGAQYFLIQDGTFVFTVLESELLGAPVDLTGDGDTLDQVPLISDPVTGSIEIVPMPVSINSIALEGNRLYASVQEGAWSRDLDGDGSMTSTILVNFDRTTRTTNNSGAQVVVNFIPALKTFETGALFVRIEAGIIDLNGDGDTTDYIYAYIDHATGLAQSLGLAAAFPTILSNAYEAALGVFAVDVNETLQDQDLNGDGDKNDQVWVLFDTVTGQQTVVPYAAQLSILPILVDDRVFFSLSEAAENSPAGGDLNGDGLLDAGVLHAYDLRTGMLTNVGLRVDSGGSPVEPYQVNGQLLIEALESFDGVDRTGDGLADARALVFVSLSTLEVTNFGRATGASPRIPRTTGGRPLGEFKHVFFVEVEVSSARDINGDGDMSDLIVSRLLAQ